MMTPHGTGLAASNASPAVAIAASGGDAFADYQVPLAVLALQQGLGRLIRHRTDRGVLAVLDARSGAGFYAVPGMDISAEIVKRLDATVKK